MNVRAFVKSAWDKVIEDFNEACKAGLGCYWNEEVLRLSFFKHLLEQDIKITWFSADVEIWIGAEQYRPDLTIDCEVNDEIKSCVFEFKFWGNLAEWKEAWDRILRYKDALYFDYGYFLAIGPSTRVEEFPREVEKLDGYEAEALIYGMKWKEAFGLAPAIVIARDLARKTLNMPLQVFEAVGWVSTIPDDYAILFDLRSKEDKLLLILISRLETGSEEEKELEKRLRETGFREYVYLDETGTFQPCDTFKGCILLGELEINTYKENVQRAKEILARLKPVLNGLKPILTLRN